MIFWRFGALLLLFFIFTGSLFARAEYRFSYIPKQLYINQVFPVTILATNLDKHIEPTFHFDFKRGIQPISKKPLKIANAKDIFFTFYFKASSEFVKIPDLTIEDKHQIVRLMGTTILASVLEAPSDKRFCKVIASDFKVKNVTLSTFDDKNNLVYLRVEAYEANLEDMDIKGALEGGIDSLRRKGALAVAKYYLVIPANIKEIDFSYYNSIKQKFIPIKVSLKRAKEAFLNSEDLKPKESRFARLKRYTFIGMAIFFFLMLLATRDIFYLVLLVITLITLITFYIPLKKICVKEGSPLYILPLPNSTIGAIIEKRINTPLLHKYKGFYKIRYKNGISGWIKDSDVCKN